MEKVGKEEIHIFLNERWSKAVGVRILFLQEHFIPAYEINTEVTYQVIFLNIANVALINVTLIWARRYLKICF